MGTVAGTSMVLYAFLSVVIAAFAWLSLRRSLRPRKGGMQAARPEDWKALLLVDGDCALCNGFVQFVIYFNATKTIRFATQQSQFGQRMLRENNQPMDLSTMVMMERIPGTIDDVNCYVKSTGVLRTMKFLDAPANLLGAALAIPVWFRDPCYATVARWRYVIFGNTTIKLSKERGTLGSLLGKTVPKPMPSAALPKCSSFVKQYSCPQCSRKYATEHGLKVHMLCHGVQ